MKLKTYNIPLPIYNACVRLTGTNRRKSCSGCIYRRGIGAQRLKRFYDNAAAIRQQLLNKYDMQDDAEFICLHKLKEIGVDVKAWSEQLPEHIVIHADKDGRK